MDMQQWRAYFVSVYCVIVLLLFVCEQLLLLQIASMNCFNNQPSESGREIFTLQSYRLALCLSVPTYIIVIIIIVLIIMLCTL